MKTCKIFVCENSPIYKHHSNLIIYGFRDLEDEKIFPSRFTNLIRIIVDEPNKFTEKYLFFDPKTGISYCCGFRTNRKELAA